MIRVVSQSARSMLAVLVTATLVAAPAAADEIVPPDGYLTPPNLEDITYPPAWDPDLQPHLIQSPLGLVLDPETDRVFDPLYTEIIDITTGDIVDYETGDYIIQLLPEELSFLKSMFDPDALTGFEQPAPPAFGSTEPTEPLDATAQSAESAGAQLPSEAPGPGNPTTFENEDDVLQHYRLGTPLSELGDYAVDTAALPEGAIDEAFQFTAYEIALLFELNAFDRNTEWYTSFEAIHDAFDLDDTSRAEVLRTFVAVDEQFATRSNLFGQALTADDFYVQWLVQPLPQGFVEQAARGEWAFLNGFEYAAGLLRLSASGGAVETTVTGSTTIELETALAQAMEALAIQEDLNELLRLEAEALRSAVAALSNPAIDAVSDLDNSATGSKGVFADHPIALGGAAVVLVAALVWFLGRRRRGGTAPDPVRFATDETVATAQMLAGAKDEEAIVRVLDRAAARQLKSSIALFHVVPEGLRLAGGEMIVTESDLQLVVDSGQRSVRVLDDDPAFPGESRAVVATPVIHGGKVQAVLVAHRSGSEHFTEADQKMLEPIAPALGGALERAAELGTMSQLAMVDGLTSLGNRRRLDGDLETTISTAVAGGAPLGFAMIDVDHFKTYNDTHGHSAGDEVLRRVAATISRCVRGNDVVYRYGGEEFSMLLPGATPEEAAMVAERVRAAVEAEVFPGEEHQPGGSLTISVGVATLSTGSGDDIRERADQALYRAKEQGRNQIAFA